MKYFTLTKQKSLNIALTYILVLSSQNVNATTYDITGSFTMFGPNGGLTDSVDTTLTGTFDDTNLNSMAIASTKPFFGVLWTAYNIGVTQTPGILNVETCPIPSDGSVVIVSGNNVPQPCEVQRPPLLTGTIGADQWGVSMLFDWSTSLKIDVINIWNVDYGSTGVITLESTDINGNNILGTPFLDGPFSTPGAAFNANFNLSLTPPFVTDLKVIQAGGETSIVDIATGVVTVTDGISGGATGLTYNWNNGATDAAIIAIAGGSESTDTLTFNPASLAPGAYTVSLSATATSPVGTVRADSSFSVPSITLIAKDTDGDGVNDNDPAEGFGDSDGDGIPNYLDHNGNTDTKKLQTSVTGDNTSASFVEVSNGILKVGKTAKAKYDSAGESQSFYNNGTGNGHGPVLATSDMDADEKIATSCIGGCYDFEVSGLANGEAITVTIPLTTTIAKNSVYRKFLGSAGWKGFKIDDNNNVASAAATSTNPTVCPAPGNSAYTAGLTIGNQCVQLTMNDGGPNDADTLANGTLVDPGGIATTSQTNLEDTSPAIDNVGGLSLYLFGFLASLITLFRQKSIK